MCPGAADDDDGADTDACACGDTYGDAHLQWCVRTDTDTQGVNCVVDDVWRCVRTDADTQGIDGVERRRTRRLLGLRSVTTTPSRCCTFTRCRCCTCHLFWSLWHVSCSTSTVWYVTGCPR